MADRRLSHGAGEAARRLAAGEVVAFPTETVYGLGADAMDPVAVAKIFAIKGRPADHPLIVHLRALDDVSGFASELPDSAKRLAARFWPGPLTLILRKARHVPEEVTGGQDTVGIRVPSHPVAREMLEAFAQLRAGKPAGIAAPSANRFGHVSPTTAQHVRDEFGDAVPVLDGGDCEVGLESTIVDVSRGAPVLLRPGGVSRGALEEALGAPLRERDADAPRASGTLAAHYAPRTELVLAGADQMEGLVAREDVAVLSIAPRGAKAGAREWISGGEDPVSYGHHLYANLRRLDASGARRIVVETPPATPAWEAINDRLRRAAAGAAGMDDEP